MNPLVNFNKRSVDLPAGCKDLIDVLRPAAGGACQSDSPTGHSRHIETVGKLVELPGRIAELTESQAAHIFLGVSPLDDRFEVFVSRMKGEPSRASVTLNSASELVPATRSFFEAWGLRAPGEGPLPSSFVESLPTYLIFRFDPLPIAAGDAAVAHVVFHFVRDVGGIALDGELRYRRTEVGDEG